MLSAEWENDAGSRKLTYRTRRRTSNDGTERVRRRTQVGSELSDQHPLERQWMARRRGKPGGRRPHTARPTSRPGWSEDDKNPARHRAACGCTGRGRGGRRRRAVVWDVRTSVRRACTSTLDQSTTNSSAAIPAPSADIYRARKHRISVCLSVNVCVNAVIQVKTATQYAYRLLILHGDPYT